MMPLGDDNSDRRLTPYVTYGLIAANVLVFWLFQGMGTNEAFTYRFSAVPREILTGKDVVTEPQEMTDPVTEVRYVMPGLGRTPGSVYLTLLTSIFMHGSLMHLFGNMLYLWIFGDNVEDCLGYGKFLVFYLLTGILASLTHVFTNATGEASLIPTLGASGAISGILGAYLVLFPHRRVRMLMIRIIVDVPAIVAIGLWFVFQVVSGMADRESGGGGVAYGAHIGGFVAGAALIKPFCILNRGQRKLIRGN